MRTVARPKFDTKKRPVEVAVIRAILRVLEDMLSSERPPRRGPQPPPVTLTEVLALRRTCRRLLATRRRVRSSDVIALRRAA